MKKSLSKILVSLVLPMTLVLGSCDININGPTNTSENGQTGSVVNLNAPTGLYVDGNIVLRWDSVDNASTYVVHIDNEAGTFDKQYERTTVACDLSKILKTNGMYYIKVKSTSNRTGTLYDSAWSNVLEYEFTKGISETGSKSTGLFSQFEDAFTHEAYIGYGYDVIGSSYINSEEVKYNYPIFDSEKLANQRLMMINERTSSDEYISGNSVESYQEAFEAKLSTKVKAKKVFSGSISAKFSHTTDSTSSALFYEYRHTTTNYQLVLQCDFEEYKNMLTSSFKRDLLRLDAGTLFERYGTHVITSVLMGGRFDLNYTMLSDSHIEASKMSGEIDTTFKAWAVDVNIDASASVSETAKSNKCSVSSTAHVYGGNNSQMNNEKVLLSNYQKWIDSVESKPALVGIRDINSLVGIWDLLGDSEEEQERKAYLKGVFEKYGEDTFEELLENYGINTPIYPESVYVDVKDSSGKTADLNAVPSGSTLFLNIRVEPEIAIVSKTVTIDHPEYALYHEIDSSIDIVKEVPNKQKINILVSVGHGVQCLITIYVARTYDITFETSGGSTVEPILNVKWGTYIDKPKDPVKEGYIFDGWYYFAIPGDKTSMADFDFKSMQIFDNYELFARWIEFRPAVSFVSNYPETENVYGTINVDYGGTIAIPEEKVYSGYTFGGFYADRNRTIEFDFGQAITSNTTIYEKWYKNPTVSFVAEHEDVQEQYADMSVTYDGMLSITPLTVIGYNFVGFYSDPSMTAVFNFNQRITADTIVYVKYSPKTYTVTFDSNGGNEVPSQTVEYKGYAKKVSCTKAGSTFAGWFKSDGQQFDFLNEKITDNITLVAKWTADPVCISFVTYCSYMIEDKTIDRGASLGESLPTPEREGYLFGGWFKDVDFTIRVYKTTTYDQNTTLYAKWNPWTYTLVFDANGGTGSMNEMHPSLGKTYVLPKSTFTREGYDFVGWSKTSGGTVLFSDSATIDSDLANAEETITLYAVWQAKKYLVSFNSDGGTEVSSIYVEYDSKAECPTSPVKEGYVFQGWYADDGSLYNFDNPVVSDVDLKAKWKFGTFFINYFDYDGNLIESTKIDESNKDAVFCSPASYTGPVPSGFKFIGWEVDGTIMKEVRIEAPRRSYTIYAACGPYSTVQKTTTASTYIDNKLQNFSETVNIGGYDSIKDNLNSNDVVYAYVVVAITISVTVPGAQKNADTLSLSVKNKNGKVLAQKQLLSLVVQNTGQRVGPVDYLVALKMKATLLPEGAIVLDFSHSNEVSFGANGNNSFWYDIRSIYTENPSIETYNYSYNGSLFNGQNQTGNYTTVQ